LFAKRKRSSHHILTAFITVTVALAMALVFLPPVSGMAEGSAYRSSKDQGDVSGLQSKVWYLAEGYTAGDFDTWVLVQNPGDEDTDVTMEFQLPEGASAEPYAFTLPANSRKSVLLDDLPGLAATEVSTMVTSTSDIYVQRSIYFDLVSMQGSTSTVGSVCPDFNWYFAEGYTGGLFETYVLVQNPGDRASSVTLEFQLPPGANAEPYTMEVPPFSRRTVNLGDVPGLGSTDVSTRVTSTEPVVAERAMYFDYYGVDGGDCAMGLNNPDKEFYIPEGYTGGKFDTYVLVQNPGDDDVDVTLEFQLPDGANAENHACRLSGNTRQTVHLDDLPGLDSTEVSTLVTSSKPVVVERAMYFDYNGIEGGSCSTACDSVSDLWQVTEGCTGDGFDTFVLVQNLVDDEANVTLDFQLAPGFAYDPYDLKVPANSRETVHLNQLEGFPETDVSTTVHSDVPVIVESAMYFDNMGVQGGHSSLGHIPNMLMPNGVMLDTETEALVTSAAGDTVMFSGTNELVESLDVGDVVCAYPCQGAPSGFLRKVNDIQHAGGETTLVTEQADIEQLIRYGNFFGSSDGVPGEAGGASHTFPFDLDLAGCGELKGQVTVGVDVDISVHIKWKWHIIPVGVHFKMSASIDESVGLDLTATKDFSLKEEVKVGTFDLPPIDAGPLVFFPKVNVYVGFDGNLRAGTNVSCSESLSARAGFGYDGHWYTIHSFDAKASADASLPYKPMDARTYVKEEIECLLYDVVGPYVDLQEYIRIHSDPNADPWWVIYAGVQSDGGIDINLIIKHFKWHGEIFSKEWAIAHAPLRPKITGVSPQAGTVGTAVTITGSEFGDSRDGSTVSFGPWEVTDYVSWSGDKIICKVPAGASGVTPVTVTNAGGVSDPVDFNVVPNIDSIDPTSGTVGTEVTVNGSAFGGNQGNSYVSFGPSKATDYVSWSNNRVVCKVPAGAAGVAPVTVTTGGGTSNAVNFGVTPHIDNLDAGSGTAGSQFAINGSAFGDTQDGSTVSFGAWKVTDYVSWSDNQVVCKVPAGAFGVAPVTVTTGGGGSNPVNFSVIPNIDGIDPTSGTVETAVTIAGSAFGNAQNSSSVSFGAWKVTDYVSWSNNSVVCMVPLAASGVTPVTVTTSGGTSDGVNFSVIPHIDNVDPTSGTVGTQVTINGSAFGNSRRNSSVSFGPWEVTDYVSWSNFQVVCKVPSPAFEDVEITVTTDGGTSGGIPFGVLPRIDSLDPNAGGMDSDITVKGSAFGSDRGKSLVIFGTTETAEYYSWSDGEIKCKVPEGPTGGLVKVITVAGSSNGREFTVLTPTWYLAEGSAAWGFNTYFTIENPNPEQVTADVEYMTPDGPEKAPRITLPGHSQTTVNPRAHLGWDTDFSTRVTCVEGKTIAVDRTMEWTGEGAPSPDGHSSIGVVAPARQWFMPEGSSAWGFECWLLIGNPNDSEASCEVTYMIEGEGPRTFTKKVPPNSRRSYSMADDIGAADASIRVESDLPVIPERSMYRNARREGHDSIGTTLPAQGYYIAIKGKGLSHDCYLAEGSTDWGFTTYVLVMNPNDEDAQVTIVYHEETGPVPQESFVMPPNSRKTVRVNDILPGKDFSIHVHGDKPVAAERAMYWGEMTPLGQACHGTIGMTDTHNTFYFPDGQTSDGRETYTLVQNPNSGPVEVKISSLSAEGKIEVTFTEVIPGGSRRTYPLSDMIDESRASILIECKTPGKRIMAERAMYWNNRGAGTCTIGGFEDRQL